MMKRVRRWFSDLGVFQRFSEHGQPHIWQEVWAFCHLLAASAVCVAFAAGVCYGLWSLGKAVLSWAS